MALLKARTPPPTPAAAKPPRATIASAAIVKQSTLRQIPDKREWQNTAWLYYDEVGELHAASNWLSNALSRIKLYVGELPDDATQGDPSPTTNEPAKVPLDELFGGASGHASMLARLGIHLTVPGESYVVAADVQSEPGITERRWLVASTDEFEKDRNGGVKVRLPDSDDVLTLDLDAQTTSVIRFWRPHARRAWDADSPTRACLGALKELMDCSAHITASLESRLAGAGLLVMPASATMPTAATAEGAPELHEDPAYASLIEAMVTPIGNRDSASAVVPILVKVDDAATGKIQYLSFATPLDANVQHLREAAIRRLALGLDVPPEVLLGMTDANHWTGWQVEESAVKLSVEPVATLIVNGLTRDYLRPALAALGVADPERYVIWYDVSELVLRPNRAEQALALWRENLLSWKAVLREGGFSEDDYPDDAERAVALLIDLVTKNVSPDVAKPYLQALSLSIADALPDAPAPPAPGAGPPPVDGPPDPPPPEDGGREIPDTPGNPGNPAVPGGATTATAVLPPAWVGVWQLAAVEVAVLRALEVAGKRLLSGNGRTLRGKLACPSWEIHTQVPAGDYDMDRLLEGAFATFDASILAAQPCTRVAIDRYVRALIQGKTAHRPAYLTAALVQAGCVPADTAADLDRMVACATA